MRVTKSNKKNIDSQTGWLIHCWIFIGLFCCQIGWTMPKIMKRSTFFYGWASLSENINQSATEAKCMRNQIVVTTLKAQLLLCCCRCRCCSCWWYWYWWWCSWFFICTFSLNKTSFFRLFMLTECLCSQHLTIYSAHMVPLDVRSHFD